LWTLQSKKLNAPKKQRKWYSGKKKRHTAKTLILLDMLDRRILAVANGKGNEHDFAIFKRTFRWVDPDVCVLADSGFQGIYNIHKNSWIPQKRSKGGKLTKIQRTENKLLSSHRICVEHAIRYTKRFKILSARYRNKRERRGLRVSLLSGICNFMRG